MQLAEKLIFIFLLGLACPPVCAALPPGASPVSKSQLSGQKLTSKRNNFSVIAPNNWQWLTINQFSSETNRNGVTTICEAYVATQNNSYEAYSVYAVSTFPIRKIGQIEARKLAEVDLEPLKQFGMKVSDFEFQPINNTSNTYRYSYNVTKPTDGSKMKFIGYVFTGNGLIKISSSMPQDRESKIFSDFIASVTTK